MSSEDIADLDPLFFLRKEAQCWICRKESVSLTAEHKFKASDLKSSFGGDQMAKFSGKDWDNQRPKYLKSPKSKNAKFRKSICASCNNHRTKKHDEAYAEFSNFLRELMKESLSPSDAVNFYPWNISLSTVNMDCVNYFNKLIGCHAAETDSPIPTDLANNIYYSLPPHRTHVTIDCNSSWQAGLKYIRNKGDSMSLVSHTGLALMLDKKSLLPNGYRAGIQIDWAEVFFEYSFTEAEQDFLIHEHRDFIDNAKNNLAADD